MEKSIENIWKEGFLKSDALIAPQINDLYNKKSIHIFDKFKRMFRINLMAIVAFSFIFLIISFSNGVPLMGGIFFIVLTVFVIINKKLLNGLEEIDKGDNSYQYLKAFKQWIEKQVAINKRMATFLYPLFFMSIVIGFWFVDAEGIPLGERLVSEVLYVFPNLYLIQGIPLIIIIGFVVLLLILAFLGPIIYKWDLNLIYGRVFRKIDELLIDINALKE